MLGTRNRRRVAERPPDPAIHAPPRRTQDAAELCDAHGADLFSLASVVLADRARAVTVVVESLVDDSVHLEGSSNSAVRRDLARSVYLRCASHRHPAPGQTTEERKTQAQATREAAPHPRGTREAVDDSAAASSAVTMSRLKELSGQQRAAIALSMFGGHSCADIAELMALPYDTVASLLRSGMHELLPVREQRA